MKERITKVEKSKINTWRRKIYLKKGKAGYMTATDYMHMGFLEHRPHYCKPTMSISPPFGDSIFLDDGREVPVSNIAFANERELVKSEQVILIHKEVGRWPFTESRIETIRLGESK